MPQRSTGSQTAAIRRLELGDSIPSSLAFRAELKSLTQYYPTTIPFAAQFTQHPAGSLLRNAHIVHIAASSDRALTAIASSDGRIELHEPVQADSHRLSLDSVSEHSRISALAYTTYEDADMLFAAASNTAVINHYNLNTCRSDRPTTKLKFRQQAHRSITDIITLNPPILAAARQSEVAIFDVRHARGETAAVPLSGCTDPVLASQQHFLLVADGNRILVLDRRKMPSADTRAQKPRSLSMGGQAHATVMTIPLPLPCQKSTRYNWISALPAGPDGLFAFHATDGTVGTVDIMSRAVVTLQETQSRRATQTELSEYGMTEASISNPSWYIRRRRGDIVQGINGQDWRIIVPNVLSRGVRIVAFGPNLPMQYFVVPVTKRHDVTCVHAVDGLLNKMLIGTAKNEVKAFEVDVARFRQTEPPDSEG